MAIAGPGVPGLRADQLVLQNGGQLPGELRGASPSRPDAVQIQTAHGIRLTLARNQLRQVVRQSAAELEYERRAPRVADTVDRHWRLCEWCLEQGLSAEREAHLRRILQLDPDHVAARHALGYSELNGQWVTQQEQMRSRGYQRHRGRWRLPQEIELEREQASAQQAHLQWLVKLKRWREQLHTEQASLAARQITEIRDPAAVGALAQGLGQEPLRAVKLLYLTALEGIGSAAALEVLIACSLNDPDTEMFHECVDRLARLKAPLAVPRYIKALEDENNVRLNRAAHALGRLGDPHALAPLIQALVTTHKVVVTPPNAGSADTISSTFGRGTDATGTPLGGTGLSTGGGPLVSYPTVPNTEVLDALVKLSGGQNFGFDQRAWRHWLAQEQTRPVPANLQRQ
ncbi:MAG: HEAT repeat domain-containing protein [Pirellulaceae bacterium]|nr:HEAT repeat domain-containing protein [Pirellulaceae bacterium]